MVISGKTSGGQILLPVNLCLQSMLLLLILVCDPLSSLVLVCDPLSSLVLVCDPLSSLVLVCDPLSSLVLVCDLQSITHIKIRLAFKLYYIMPNG